MNCIRLQKQSRPYSSHNEQLLCSHLVRIDLPPKILLNISGCFDRSRSSLRLGLVQIVRGCSLKPRSEVARVAVLTTQASCEPAPECQTQHAVQLNWSISKCTRTI